MSVINKVLRDLDKRQSNALAAPTAAEEGLRSGTAGVEALEPMPRARKAPKVAVRWTALSLLVLLLALVGGGVAVWQNGMATLLADAPAKPIPPVVVQVAPAAPVVMPATAVPPEPVASGPIAQAPVPPAIEPVPAGRFEPALVIPKEQKPSAAPPPVPAKAPAAVPAPAAVVASAPAVVAPSPRPVASAPSAAEMAQKQQQAAREALAQSQSLWNAGSRDAAMDLLQQAVASTERSAQNAQSAGTTQTLVMLVRELSRMQLAEGRAGAVWDTLTRLEPLLRNEPEMWAVRANAAQRLGRHQDSVHAYMTALQSRPNEQRWLLGAAVSLAALGQTASAADMAEKARVAGPISREVQTYLRQMGVPLKDL